MIVIGSKPRSPANSFPLFGFVMLVFARLYFGADEAPMAWSEVKGERFGG
jgi:hypothetical protein